MRIAELDAIPRASRTRAATLDVMMGWRKALAVVGLGALLGCHSTITGYNGKFTIAYESSVDVTNFVKPIAPGAKLDVIAFVNGTDDELAIVKATSSKPSVISIDGVRAGKVTLFGREPGVAEIEISVRDSAGKTVTDKMFFHVAKPAKHGLEHACTDEAAATYVAGEPIDLYHGMATEDKRAIVGTGYAPMTVAPASALKLVAQPQAFNLYRFKSSGPAEKITVTSAVDGKVLTMRIVDRKELTQARLSSPTHIIERQTQYAVVNVRHGDAALCHQRALTQAKSLTPEICKVSARLDEEGMAESNRAQLAVIEGLKFGICEYEVTLPELAQGKGIVLKGTTKVGRIELPGGSGEPAKAHQCVRWERAAIWFGGTRAVLLAAVFAWLKLRRRFRVTSH